VLFFYLKTTLIPENGWGADNECTRIFLKVIGVISLCMILVLPDRFYQDAAFFCVTPLIRHPELVSGSQKVGPQKNKHINILI